MASSGDLPSLARLSVRVDGHEDRDDKIVGGCRPGNPLETKCFDDWIAQMASKVLEAPKANTLILLSAGWGVLELRAVKLLLTLRVEADLAAIEHLFLIDPYMPAESVAEVVAGFEDGLLGVTTHYFSGERAYDDALVRLRDTPSMEVAVVGALNFGVIHAADRREINTVNTMLALVELAERRIAGSGRVMYVITAWHNGGAYVNKEETVSEFIASVTPKLKLALAERHSKPAVEKKNVVA